MNIETRITERRFEEGDEEQRSPFPREWGMPPLDLTDRLAWAKGHASRVLQAAMERRRIDPALRIDLMRHEIEVMRRGPV